MKFVVMNKEQDSVVFIVNYGVELSKNEKLIPSDFCRFYKQYKLNNYEQNGFGRYDWRSSRLDSGLFNQNGL